MPQFRRILISALVALVATGFAMAVAQDGVERPAPAKVQAKAPAQLPPNPAAMQQLLKDWEIQSQKLKTLEVSIYRIDVSPAWGDEDHFEGRAIFSSPQLAYLDFRKVKLVLNEKKKKVPQVDRNKRRITAPFERIVCTENEVWQYRFDDQHIFVFPLDKNARKRAIEEGPLPFLFNMKAKEAEARYDMVLLEKDAKRILLKITPKLKEDQDSFSMALVVLDADFLLPTRIQLLAPDRKSTKVFYLSQIKANEPVNPKAFQVFDPGKPWKIERNPGGQAPASQARGPIPRRQPNAQEAQRPLAPGMDQPR